MKELETETSVTEKATESCRGGGLVSNLPSLDTLDQLTYQIIAFGFPLLTLVIITGAIWAQTAWGRWWGWDPKETASLVAWLIYAGYLHGRLRRNWRGAPAAAFAILGFVTILFCYAGVNLIPGLHSYGGQVVREGGRMVLGGFQGISTGEIWLTQGFMWAYVLAMFAYLAFAVTRNLTVGKAATVLAWAGFVTLTVVLGWRTHEAGRLPLTSGYDFGLCFVWGVSVAHLVAEQLLQTKMLGAFALPIMLLLTMYAYLLFPSKENTLLMPALQNRFWLHFHVSVAIFAYGALALSCATAIMYLVKHRWGDRREPAAG